MAVGDTILLRVAEDGSVLDDDNQVLVHALGDALELDPSAAEAVVGLKAAEEALLAEEVDAGGRAAATPASTSAAAKSASDGSSEGIEGSAALIFPLEPLNLGAFIGLLFATFFTRLLWDKSSF